MTTTQIGGLCLSTALRATMFFLTLFALAPAASAQTEVFVGNRFGVFRSDLSGDGVTSSETEDVGMPFNLMLGVQVGRVVGLQTELNVTERGGSAVAGDVGTGLGTGEFSVGYLEVPVLVRAQVPVRVGPYAAAFAGPALAFRTGRSDLAERFSDTVLSGVVGGELGVMAADGRAFVDVRYNVGIGGLLNDDAFGGAAPDVTASGFALTVGGAANLSTLFGGGR